MSFLRNLFHRPEPMPVDESGALYQAVKDAMFEVQAYARSHGGEIRLLSVTEEGEANIQLLGTCKGCPMASITVRLSVEEHIKRLVPGVQKVTVHT